MKYTQEMMLHSDSGYCMPFEERDRDVEVTLGYGKQRHPQTGETFFHHGVDFKAHRYLLSAVATGQVSGIGSDAGHGIYQVIRYGRYEVTYSHLSNVFKTFGNTVKAGQIVAVSDHLLHMEVRFDGRELNPRVPYHALRQHQGNGAERTGRRPRTCHARHGSSYPL